MGIYRGITVVDENDMPTSLEYAMGKTIRVIVEEPGVAQRGWSKEYDAARRLRNETTERGESCSTT